MQRSWFSRSLAPIVPACLMALVLCALALGSARSPVASAQVPVFVPGTAPYILPVPVAGGVSVVGTTFVPVAGNVGVTLSGGLVLPTGMMVTPSSPSTAAIPPTGISRPLTSGRYCTDSTGGRIWIAAGAPTEGLSCPAS
jgi:hypothetical protein